VVCSEVKNDKVNKQTKHAAIMKSAKVRGKYVRYRNEEKKLPQRKKNVTGNCRMKVY